MMIKSYKSQNKTILITIAVALTFSLFSLSETSVSFGQTNPSKSSISDINNNDGSGNSNLKATTSDISVSNFQIVPSPVHVGNSLEISATMTNNSPNPISYGLGCSFSPLSATFDKNVHTSTGGNACNSVGLATLNPREKTQITGPSVDTTYTAIGTGPTKAKITFKDFNEEISKSVTFTILK